MKKNEDVKWTLWVFAGPGALNGTPGHVLPIADRVRNLPAGVELRAETVSEPTLLQQLTGEWPTQRLHEPPAKKTSTAEKGKEPPPAERSLWRFLEWASSSTAKQSKRALIVLGDALQAIGEAPKDLVPGGYRPPYPATIKITRDTTTTPYEAQRNPPDAHTEYKDKTVINGKSDTISGWLAQLETGNSVEIDGTTWVLKNRTSSVYQKNGDGNLYTINPKPNYIDTTENVAYPGKFTTQKKGSSHPRTYTQIDNQSYEPPASGDNMLNIISGQVTDLGDTLKFDSRTYTLFEKPPHAPRIYEASGSKYTITFHDTEILITDIGQAPTTTPGSAAERSIDDIGPAPVSLAMRRVDVLATALDGHEIDLVASDDPDLLQVAALRRIAPRTKVLLGARQHRPGTDQPLAALLGALREEVGLSPEALAKKAVEGADRSTGLMALRSSDAKQLAAELDTFASRALSTPQLKRCFEDAWNGGKGDLAPLITRLKDIDREQANRIEECANATIIGGSSVGLGLDGPGLQLGPPSAWTRLLDSVGGHSDIMRSTLQDLQALTANARRASRLASTPAEAHCVLDYTPIDEDNHFARFLEEDLKACNARHVTLVIRGKWQKVRSGSVTCGSTSLPVSVLAQCLQNALCRRGRGPLALLVLEDPKLLRVENAYELREVAHVLMTAVAGKTLEDPMDIEESTVVECERRAADELGKTNAGSIPPLVHVWHRDVAVYLAESLCSTHGLQGIELRHLGALCRMLDRVCRQMYDHINDKALIEATKAGKDSRSLHDWLSRIINRGFWSVAFESAGLPKLHHDLYALFEWISVPDVARRNGGAPLWIRPDDPKVPPVDSTSLLISVGSPQSKDYHRLSFNQDVSLHALLTAACLLQSPEAYPYWGLISMGLAYGPDSQRRAWFEKQVVAKPDAPQYFSTFGTPPLMSLAIEQNRNSYDLRLQSSESQATLVHQRRFADLEGTKESFEKLGLVMSGSMASGQGCEYLEGLGASLAEDVLGSFRDDLEHQRGLLFRTGRCREAHLALALPRELMHWPWELMHLPAWGSGRGLEMLAERFAVGRQMWMARELPRMKRRQDRFRVLIVADPITNLGGDLPAARNEGRGIQQLCMKMNEDLRGVVEFECDVSIHEAMTRTVLRQRLRRGNYDVLHFAGHGVFDANPDLSYWALTDGKLTATELSNTLSSCEAPPWLIYANACSAGMIDKNPSPYHGEVYGMAGACIGAGVSAYVAPLWRIQDESARWLAEEFYRLLLLEGRTIGVALQHARMHVRKIWEAQRGDVGLGDISWAGMVLFGNPGGRLREAVG